MHGIVDPASCLRIVRNRIWILKAADLSNSQSIDHFYLAACQAVAYPHIFKIHITRIGHRNVIGYRLPRVANLLIRMLCNRHCRMIDKLLRLWLFRHSRRSLNFLLCIFIIHPNCNDFFRPSGHIFGSLYSD